MRNEHHRCEGKAKTRFARHARLLLRMTAEVAAERELPWTHANRVKVNQASLERMLELRREGLATDGEVRCARAALHALEQQQGVERGTS